MHRTSIIVNLLLDILFYPSILPFVYLQQLLLEIKEMLGSVLEMLRRDEGARVPIKQEDEAFIVGTLCIILLVLPHYLTLTPLLLYIMQSNGVNLMRVPSNDALAYGRALLYQLFTKQEQKQSIPLSSKE